MPLLSGETHRRIPGLGCAFGCLAGVLLGILLTLTISIMAARIIPRLTQAAPSNPAVTVEVQEDYLNSEAAKQINGSYPTGIDALTLTALQIDTNPDNRLDLHASFNINLGFFTVPANASVSNQITAQDGHMALNMVGAPQIGNLSIPIDSLPFNLEDKIRSAIDYVNNNLILKQLNQTLAANLTGTNLDLDTVSTSASALTLHLKQK